MSLREGMFGTEMLQKSCANSMVLPFAKLLHPLADWSVF